MKKLIILIFCCMYAQLSLAQFAKSAPSKNKVIWGPSLAYQYQKGNFLKASAWGLFAPNESQYMKVDAGANFARMQGQTIFIPELGFTYYLSTSLLFPFVKAEITPYTITPKVGISILSLIDIGLGYGMDIRTKSNFKKLNGFTGSLSVNIPLNFYL